MNSHVSVGNAKYIEYFTISSINFVLMIFILVTYNCT